MSKLSVSLAISDYDHVRDFVYGRVTAEGLDINFQVLPTPEIFDRATRDQEWDVCEMSLGKWTGMFSQGDDSLVPIPVFPSRVFRHSALYVKKGSGVDTLDKLRGKRVGDPDFAHTAGIYARGYLMHDVGIKLEEIEWVQAGTNKPGRHENLELNLPATVKRVSVPDKTLDDMLLAGEIDAILSAIPPKSFIAGNPNMVRLVQNHVEVETEYFNRTGIFPIMHFVAIKRPLFERNPWMAVNLYRAFEEAKDRSIARIKNMMISHFPLPWNPDNGRRATAMFGAGLLALWRRAEPQDAGGVPGLRPRAGRRAPQGDARRGVPGERPAHPQGLDKMDLGIRGRKALLCGASRGLGKAAALAVAKEGVDVTIVARTRDVLERTAAGNPRRHRRARDRGRRRHHHRSGARGGARAPVRSRISCSTTPTARCPATSAPGRAISGSRRSTR